MTALVLRVAINALALAVATWLVEGIRVASADTGSRVVTIVVVAAVFGVVNAVVKPVVKALTGCLYLVTLGLFTLVVNGLMLLLTGWIAGQLDVPFRVHGFWAAVLGALIVSVVSFAANLGLAPDRRR